MKSVVTKEPVVIPVDAEHARMMAYAQSEEAQRAIAKADAEIAAGKGIVADDAYFENLRARRKERGTSTR